jgi:hypothetical protein
MELANDSGAIHSFGSGHRLCRGRRARRHAGLHRRARDLSRMAPMVVTVSRDSGRGQVARIFDYCGPNCVWRDCRISGNVRLPIKVQGPWGAIGLLRTFPIAAR